MTFAARPNYASVEVVQPLPGGTVQSTTITPSDASATLNFNRAGTVTSSRAGAGSTVSHDWHLNPTATVGDGFWVRATLAAGTTPTSGTIGSWTQLSATSTWNNTRTITGNKTSTLTIELATDSGGANIVTSGTYIINADEVS